MASFVDRFAAAGKALIAPSAAVPAITKAAGPVLELKASEARAASMYYRVGVEQYPPGDYATLVKQYGTNAVVRACVKRITEAASQIPPVARVNGKESDKYAEAVARFIRSPNPRQDRRSLIEEMAGFFLLHGNAFLELVPGMSANYAQMYNVRPEYMRIVPGADGWVQKYVFRPGTGAEKHWPVDIERGKATILHVKDFAPDDDLWGRGALKSVEKELDTYNNAWDYARALVKNGAMPSGALKYAPQVAAGEPSPSLTDEQFQKLKAQMNAQSEMRNKGKPLLLDGGLDWVAFSWNLVDMQADEMRNGAARGIALGFGVPPMLLGIPGDNTYSNYKEANRAFYRGTVIPLVGKLYGAIGRWLGAYTGQRELELGINEDDVYALAEELTETYQRLESSRFLTLDEKREAAGYDKLPEGLGARVMVNGFETPLDASLATAEIGIESAAEGLVSAQLSNQLMANNPGYEPGKDRDKDGTSAEGGPSEGGVAKPKEGRGSK